MFMLGSTNLTPGFANKKIPDTIACIRTSLKIVTTLTRLDDSGTGRLKNVFQLFFHLRYPNFNPSHVYFMECWSLIVPAASAQDVVIMAARHLDSMSAAWVYFSNA
jgi:hypothetical protein